MRITLSLITFFGLFLSACNKDVDIPPPNEVVTQKAVEYQISTERDYSTTWMKDVNTTIKLSIGKVGLNGGSETVLWDSTFSNLTMGQLSLLTNQTSIKRSFPVVEEKEKLVVRYSLILGEPLRAGRGSVEEIPNGVSSVIVPVRL